LTRKQRLLEINQANSEDVAAAAYQVKETEALETAEQRKLAELRLTDPNLEIQAAKTNVAVMTARLQQAEDALEDCQVKAPQDGTVLRILAGRGDVVGGSGKSGVILFAAAGPRVVRAEVEQEFARRVQSGQTARIFDDADAGQSWTGKVVRVSDWYTQRRAVLQEAPQVFDVRTVEVLIALDPGQAQPRLGLRVQASIQVEPQ
jgi:multidrug resistance efflux pump